MNQLKIFVSSTCYDLTQIRSDLFDFISNFGYQPVLSEYSTFPINPDSDTIDNCIRNATEADMLVLIVGSRYGYVSNTGKSITNTEYLYAKQKGIPIYIFVHKSLVTILPIWKKNKEADFSDTVDSVKVFEFVEELRNSNKNWCFEFEKAQEIVLTLKIQFSHLFKSALDIRQKFNNSTQPEYWKNLSAKSINIILHKELLFEPRFFIQVLRDELMKHENLKLDLDYHILLGCNKSIEGPEELLSWIQEKLKSLQQFIDSGMNLMKNAFPYYFKEPGHASDLKGLYYVAFSMARLFKEMILWSIDTKSTNVIEDFQEIRDTFAKLIITSANEIWNYPDKAEKDISFALEQDRLGKIAKVESVLTFSINQKDADFITSEMNRLVRQYTSKF